MGHSQFDGASRKRSVWKAGKRVGTKRPFTRKQIWSIRLFLYRERRIPDLAPLGPAASTGNVPRRGVVG